MAVSILKTTIGQLNMKFDSLMFPDGFFNENCAIGFTINKGKKLYWYVLPQTNGFKVVPVDNKGGLGWPRVIHGETEITIHYNYEWLPGN